MAVDWDDRDSLLEYIEYLYGRTTEKLNEAAAWFTDAWYYNTGYDYRTAIYSIIEGCRDQNTAIRCLTTYSGWPEFRYGLPYYLENYTGVTWKSICEAWIKDDFEGRAVTIAVIDRMRQLIWDEPFYVAWASKPEQQEF